MAVTKPVQGVSAPLGLDDFVQAGLIADADVEIQSLRFVLFDYMGTRPDPVLALCGTFRELGTGEISENHWTAGTGWVPNHDGTGVVRAEDSSRTGLSKGTNAFEFLESLHKNGGMPKNKLREDGGLALLDGAVIHVKRVPETIRPGLSQEPRRGGQERTVLTCTAALRWPWDSKGAKPKAGAAKPATAATAAAASSESAEQMAERALEAVMSQIDELTMDGAKGLKAACFRQIGAGVDKDLRTEAVKLIQDEDFLVTRGYVLEEGGIVRKMA